MASTQQSTQSGAWGSNKGRIVVCNNVRTGGHKTLAVASSEA